MQAKMPRILTLNARLSSPEGRGSLGTRLVRDTPRVTPMKLSKCAILVGVAYSILYSAHEGSVKLGNLRQSVVLYKAGKFLQLK